MSGSSPSGPNASFQDRLGRVAERNAPREAAKPHVDVLPDWRENIRTPMGFAIAVAIGVATVLLVRIVRFHVFGGTLIGDNADLTMAIDFVAAAALSIGLFSLTSYKGFPFVLAQICGVVLMMTTMQNMVHKAPSVFNLAFSSDWTDDVIATTEPGTLLVRGYSMALSENAEEVAEADVEPEKPALPTVRRMN